jgi:hypothetical protein
MEQWSRGVFTEDSIEETALANSNALGEMSCLNRLIELDYENLKDALEDE